ncbi:hypothetical protein ALC57_14692 [Trachymyrmex cornetzi]|uniref:Uncharacterized protein n=1 Tax=Trachymyrmex cornetzi TaxID=471704 RepID=A0A151IY78_9HYME|nr:hypothetical protein ALC57_14692 [Trachymyrmex cornetzi]
MCIKINNLAVSKSPENEGECGARVTAFSHPLSNLLIANYCFIFYIQCHIPSSDTRTIIMIVLFPCHLFAKGPFDCKIHNKFQKKVSNHSISREGSGLQLSKPSPPNSTLRPFLR